MSQKDVQDHLTLVFETGRHRLTDEQREIIRKLDGDVLEFEEEGESTLEFPQLRK